MKFEEILPLLREGKIAIDQNRVRWMIDGGKLCYRTPGGAWLIPSDYDPEIIGEWSIEGIEGIEEKPRYQYLWRVNGQKSWKLMAATYISDEDVMEEFDDLEEIELRRIEP
jgi:hypothetical protein